METIDYSQLKVGDTVILNDAESITYAIEQGIKGVILGIPLSIESVEMIEDEDTGLQCYNLKLHNNTFLFLFVINGNVDCFVNTVPDWYQAGTRSDLLNADQNFLFKEPEDPENFEIESLDITSEFTLEINGEDVQLKAAIPTVYGTNQDNKLASVSLFSCDAMSAVILDYGEDDSWIEYYEGYPVEIDQIEFLII